MDLESVYSLDSGFAVGQRSGVSGGVIKLSCKIG